MKQKWLHVAGALIALALLLAGCASLPSAVSPGASPSGSGGSREVVTTVETVCQFEMGLAYAIASAYRDADDHGVLDPTDPPLRGATFVVTFTDGTLER
jgi:hypothetical protein